MSGITPYSFEGVNIRTLDVDGETFFAGKDVAEALGYADPSTAIRSHCKGVQKLHPLQTGGGVQDVRILSEPDVLRLIVNSTLPAAARFERWVFEDVLPTIRKTGGFGHAIDPMAVLNDPAAMRTLLLGYSEKVIALEVRVNELAPMADALGRIALSDGSLCVTDAAKTLQVQPRMFTKLLQENGWIYRRPMGAGWLAYQDRIQSGLMEHKITTGEKSDGREWSNTQARITPKGLAKLAEVIQRGSAH